MSVNSLLDGRLGYFDGDTKLLNVDPRPRFSSPLNGASV